MSDLITTRVSLDIHIPTQKLLLQRGLAGRHQKEARQAGDRRSQQQGPRIGDRWGGQAARRGARGSAKPWFRHRHPLLGTRTQTKRFAAMSFDRHS
eukprot:760722-Hanusia_phi.AAC.1